MSIFHNKHKYIITYPGHNNVYDTKEKLLKMMIIANSRLKSISKPPMTANKNICINLLLFDNLKK